MKKKNNSNKVMFLTVIGVIIVIASLYVFVGGIYSEKGVNNYVKELKDSGVSCTEVSERNGKYSKMYWKCDNGEDIKSWENYRKWWKYN